MIAETDLPDRFVKLDEVKRRVGLGKSMIYRLIQEGIPCAIQVVTLCVALE